MADDGAYTADDPTLTVGPKIVCITELCDQQPSATTSTLQVEADQRTLDLAPLLSLCPNDELLEAPVGILQECDYPSTDNVYMVDDNKYTTKDDAVDDPTLTARPKIVCAISELRDQQPTTTTLTSSKSDGDGLEPATTTIQVKSAVTEQLDSYVAPVRIQLLDALADVNDLVPDEATESTTIVPIVVDKNDGDGLEPAMTTTQVKSAVTEQLDSYVAPVRIQLLDALADVNDFVPDEATKSTTIVPIVVAKSDGDGLEPAMTTIQVKSAVTEQLDSYVAPVRIQLLDALADVNDFVPDEATESTTIVPIAVAKSDGDGLEPATTAVQAKSAAAEKPRQGRRRSFLSAVGRRLLKFGRTLCCCCCCK
ncbi:uncharacterized protein LOC132946658 [Metopolophium dirhodum]|uniref:uncharacterized protein LOC132946658 n=1 Tax=Metopolophium dirhodum TaxID=44670 RepID=UPI00298FAE27|nr:uncharacterized protein LOC132946658 [Metopolophium dirhodum]